MCIKARPMLLSNPYLFGRLIEILFESQAMSPFHIDHLHRLPLQSTKIMLIVVSK